MCRSWRTGSSSLDVRSAERQSLTPTGTETSPTLTEHRGGDARVQGSREESPETCASTAMLIVPVPRIKCRGGEGVQLATGTI